MIRVSIVDGAPAESFTFEDDTVSIGRSRHNTLVLADTTLSRVHCEIAAVQGRFLLVNHARTNGTCVNGKPVGEAFLKPGDTLLVGRVALRFDGGGETSPNAPSKSGKRRLFSRAFRRRVDPMIYGVAYVAGLAAAPLIYFVVR